MELKMSNPTNNPLFKHFRQPILYTKLPSNGRWYPDGAIELTAAGEIPIYAMTAKDEITMKTPDSLLNGTSTVAVISSCCPAIKDPWKMPSVDLDTVLISIRIATYGKEMDFTAVCPHCGTKNEHAIDLSYMLANNELSPGWDEPATYNGLLITLRPQRFEEFNKDNQLAYEEQRLMQMLNSDALTEEQKAEQFKLMFDRLIDVGVKQISKSISCITLEDGTEVSDENHISEFLSNCDKKVWDIIKDQLDAIGRAGANREVRLSCTNEECSKKFSTPFVFEQASFFV